MDEFDHTTTAVLLPRQARFAKVGLLGIGAAALIAVGALVFGSTLRPAGTLAADEGSGTSGAPSQLNGGFGHGPGRPGGHGPGFAAITISAINGNDLSLTTADGWTRTITVDSGTTYSSDGNTLSQSDLKVGDEIRFRETRESDGTFTIDAIEVIPPHLAGQVTAVSGSTITVMQPDGTTATINVTSSTTYQVNRASGSLSDVKVGMFVMAEGTKGAAGSLTATEVRAGTPGEGHGPSDRGFGHGPFDGPNGPSATPPAPGSTTAPPAESSAS